MQVPDRTIRTNRSLICIGTSDRPQLGGSTKKFLHAQADASQSSESEEGRRGFRVQDIP